MNANSYVCTKEITSIAKQGGALSVYMFFWKQGQRRMEIIGKKNLFFCVFGRAFARKRDWKEAIKAMLIETLKDVMSKTEVGTQGNSSVSQLALYQKVDFVLFLGFYVLLFEALWRKRLWKWNCMSWYDRLAMELNKNRYKLFRGREDGST